GDGVVDVIAWEGHFTKGSPLRAWLLRGSGNGTFAPPQWLPELDQFLAYSDVDLNGDGRKDRVGLVQFTGGGLRRVPRGMLGNGDGTLDRALLGDDFFWQPRNANAGDDYMETFLADIDRDGVPDLVTTQGIFLGRGDGSFRAGVVPDELDAAPATTTRIRVDDL